MVRGTPIAKNIRELIIEIHLKGESLRAIEKVLKTPRTTEQGVLKSFKKMNSIIIKKKRGRKTNLTPAKERALKSVITKNRRANIGEIACEFKTKTGFKISSATCNRWLKNIGYGHYKVMLIPKKM